MLTNSDRNVPIWSAAVLVGLMVAMIPLGQDLLNNPFRTGVTIDTLAREFAYARYVLIGLCVAIALQSRTLSQSIYDVRHLLPFAAFGVISVAWSADTWETFHFSFVLLGYIIALPIIVRRLGPGRALQIAGHVFAVAIIASLVIAIAKPEIGRHNGSDAVVGADLIGKWRGIFAHKNQLGEFSATTLLICTYLTLGSGRIQRIYWALASVLSLICLALSGSATSWIGYIVGFGLYILLSNRRTARPEALVLVSLIGALIFLATSSGVSGFASTLGKNGTFTGRTGIWQIAQNVIAEAPILGHGYGATTDAVFAPIAMRELFSEAVDAHNGYLDLMMDLGVVGVGLLGLGVFVSVARGYQEVLKGGGEERRIAVLMLALVASAFTMATGEVSPLHVVGDGAVSLWMAVILLSVLRGPVPVNAFSQRRLSLAEPRLAPVGPLRFPGQALNSKNRHEILRRSKYQMRRRTP